MSQFANNEWFEVEQCCNCGMAFAMTVDFRRRRLNDREFFYCPSGHRQHYTGQTETQKLKAELEKKQRELESANAMTLAAEQERVRISKAHNKMRTRVMNGVCPCCNRTFQNLMEHMKTEHPEFREPLKLSALRTAFGMSQAQVAKEAGVHQTQVSLYERERPTPVFAKDRLDNWIERHRAQGTLQ